jgi:hypothetical protein
MKELLYSPNRVTPFRGLISFQICEYEDWQIHERIMLLSRQSDSVQGTHIVSSPKTSKFVATTVDIFNTGFDYIRMSSSTSIH